MEAVTIHNSNREDLIRSNLSFIRQVAGKHTGRVLEWGRDEELSVALIAYNSAIDSFQYQRGRDFPAFAALIIRRRLIDYYRAGRRHKDREILAGNMMEEMSDEQLTVPGCMEKLLARERRQEIISFTRNIGELDIEMEDLLFQAPKRKALRERLLTAVKVVVCSPDLYRSVISSSRLPLERLSQISGVSAAVLSKHRKYLLALVHIYANASDYPFMSTYLNLEGEEQ